MPLKKLSAALPCFLVFAFCSASLPAISQGGSAKATKPVSFAVLEDYDKGHDLNDVALDFQLLNELGIDEMRCSFGRDDYEPARGRYDFAWLKQFVALADQYGIKLRPYIGYTAARAGHHGGEDRLYWNDPPANLQDWYDFVYKLVTALKTYPNVLSYEFYNEENDSFWWEGKINQYGRNLRQASLAVRAANPNAKVILGGFVYPDYDWLLGLDDRGYTPYWDITPFHAYPETFEDSTVETYLDEQYTDYFVPENRDAGNEPIWINEMGFATTKGKTQLEQANWFARAISAFLATRDIQELGLYEIKDLPIDDPVIGGEPNYHLGLTHVDRTKKLAFLTVQMLSSLLNVGTLTTADGDARVVVTGGQSGDLFEHLFLRPDGSWVLFVYDKTASPTVQVTLTKRGSKVIRYYLDGSSSPYRPYDGQTLRGVKLTAGNVAIFRIQP